MEKEKKRQTHGWVYGAYNWSEDRVSGLRLSGSERERRGLLQPRIKIRRRTVLEITVEEDEKMSKQAVTLA